MSRKTLINIHLILTAFFLPFLLHMPLSGTLYLLGIKGEVHRELAFTSTESFEMNKESILEQFKKNGIDYNFEYIRGNGKNVTLRPSSKVHYQVHQKGNVTEFTKLSPNFVASMMELHKGHGPQLFKTLETVFGVGLLLTTISGVLLLFGVSAYLSMAMIPFGIGTVLFLLTVLI